MDPKRLVLTFDELPPEHMAKLMALYSRSAAGVNAHLEKVRLTGSAKFMEEHYVGYGHQSIGDCASTWVFLEGVSVLAAKAVEDTPLFNGQETSTRYINMGEQPIIDPINSDISRAVLARLMGFYRNSLAILTGPNSVLRQRYPQKPDDNEGTYNRAISAKAFDILRGFLPAGITTLVGWHTTLRHASDHIQRLEHHPLGEIRDLAGETLTSLQGKYASSFGQKRYPATQAYRAECSRPENFYLPSNSPLSYQLRSQLDTDELGAWEGLLRDRPQKTELPFWMVDLGLLKWLYTLDYASWRDLQRHRACTHRVSLLTTRIGFQQWYLEQLPDEMRAEAEQLLAFVAETLQGMPGSDVDKQYLTPIGYLVNASIAGGLPGVVYALDLRSTLFIHPTLRSLVHRMGESLNEVHPSVTLHLDKTQSDWDVRRGDQTIQKKKK